MKRKGLTLYIHISSWPQTILSFSFLLFIPFYVLVFSLNIDVLTLDRIPANHLKTNT